MSILPSRASLRAGLRGLAIAMPCLVLALAGQSGSAAIPATKPTLQDGLAMHHARLDVLAMPPRAGSVLDIAQMVQVLRGEMKAVTRLGATLTPPLPPRHPRLAALKMEPDAAPARRRGAIDYGVFASVAVPMGGLPMQPVFRGLLPDDARAARHALSGWKAWRNVEDAAGGAVTKAVLARVNRAVNYGVAYRTDRAVHGKPDHWAAPAEMLRRGAGDCEDFALAKLWVLAALGLPQERMQLVVLEDRGRALYHAVLAVHLDSGTYILDNATDALRRDAAIASYHPLYSFAAQGSFIHGFRTADNGGENREDNREGKRAATARPFAEIHPGSATGLRAKAAWPGGFAP